MHPLRKTARSLLFSGALLGLLTGCGSPLPPIEHTTVASIPATLLTCPDPGDAPDAATSTQKDVAVWIAGLYDAWQWCSGNLTSVKELIDKQKTEIAP